MIKKLSVAFLKPRITELCYRKLSALILAVDAEKGVCTYGGREGQATQNPVLN